ncbi:MAG: transcription elongation factor GreA [Tidjanibacter sp.]|nr:transcription elongation factor GreA [Tidjanibacter sp.]
MAETVYLTKEGYNKLKAELDQLRIEERPKAAAAIAEARDKGDLSENAEYDAAKEAQRNLEARIMNMEMTLANARILDESRVGTSKIQILNKVTLKNHNTGKTVVYTLVSDHEANLREGKLSVGTPIGKALIGKKKGDVVDVTVPAGQVKFEVLDISI